MVLSRGTRTPVRGATLVAAAPLGAGRVLALPVEAARRVLKPGDNTLSLRSGELPDFDGTTYASDTCPGVLLRSPCVPVPDRIAIAPFSAPVR